MSLPNKILPILSRERLAAAGSFLFWAVVFAISYTESPLYSTNQNQYFLQGLAKAGFGLLGEDWMANTTDPTPVFSFVVFLTYRFLHEYFFYIYHALILGVYIYSISGIASIVFRVNRSKTLYLVFLALVIAIHSPFVDYAALHLFGIDQSLLLNRGVAGQYLLGYEFQPSSLAVFLLFSIYMFLRQKPFLAVFFLAVAATFHTSSLPGAAVLTVSYMIITFRQERNIREAFSLGILALVLVLPVVIYLFINFGPGDSEALRKSHEILANWRIPHHVLSKRAELGELFYLRVLSILIALYLVRKTRLFAVLAWAFSMIAALSAIQILTDSNSLGLTFPWRLSTVLIPLSISMIAAYIVSSIFERTGPWVDRNRKRVNFLAGAVILFLVLWGVREMKSRFENYYQNESVPMMEFIKNTRVSGETYLVPALNLEELENFRLYTGAPIFIDFKAVPYNYNDVIEWYARNLKARQFYEAAEMNCEFLKELSADYHITHVIVENTRFLRACDNLQQIYKDDSYRVYKISRLHNWGHFPNEP